VTTIRHVCVITKRLCYYPLDRQEILADLKNESIFVYSEFFIFVFFFGQQFSTFFATLQEW